MYIYISLTFSHSYCSLCTPPCYIIHTHGSVLDKVFFDSFMECIDVQRRVRETLVGKTLSCRLLVVSSAEDNAEQYVSTMNCIFAAQKSVRH